MIVVDYKDNVVSLRGLIFYKYTIGINDAGFTGPVVIGATGTTEVYSGVFWQNAISARMKDDNFFGWVWSLNTVHGQSERVSEWQGDEYFLNEVCVGRVSFLSNGPFIPHGATKPISYSADEGKAIYHAHVDGLMDLIFDSKEKAQEAVETKITEWLRQVTNDMIHHSSTLMSPEWIDFKYRVLPEINRETATKSDGSVISIKIAKFSSPEDFNPDLSPIERMEKLSRINSDYKDPEIIPSEEMSIKDIISKVRRQPRANLEPFESKAPDDLHGYHIKPISKGELGEPSKIAEELEEFMDAVDQGSAVMALVELGDLVGAIEAYLEKHHPTIKINDLKIFSDITKRAFKNNFRQ